MKNNFLLKTNFDLKSSQENFIKKKIARLDMFILNDQYLELKIKKRRFSYRCEFYLYENSKIKFKEIVVSHDIDSVIKILIEKVEDRLRDEFRNEFSYHLASKFKPINNFKHD